MYDMPTIRYAKCRVGTDARMVYCLSQMNIATMPTIKTQIAERGLSPAAASTAIYPTATNASSGTISIESDAKLATKTRLATRNSQSRIGPGPARRSKATTATAKKKKAKESKFMEVRGCTPR